jgi:hypothetical protein
MREVAASGDPTGKKTHLPMPRVPANDIPTAPPDAWLARRFRAAWGFLLVSVLIGLGLRLQWVRPWTTLGYNDLLHAHSHVAFLGWVFNAFFVATLRHFVPATEARGYDRLWWTMQLAVVGMLVTFPFQGYAPASIAFSTLHMAAAFVFAVKLWRHNRAAPAARVHLRLALAFMLLSGAGPLALGVLPAMGLRESPAYTLAIYFYLHCQYNGWFPFFLQALLLQRAQEQGWRVDGTAATGAAWWLGVGGLLAFALSTLWCGPPAVIGWIAVAGGVMQAVGAARFLGAIRGVPWPANRVVRVLAFVALGSWLLKHGLHLVGPVPGLAALAQQRFVAIAFLHLVFLGLVTPGMLVWAHAQGWLRANGRFRAGAALLLLGTGTSELLLVASALAGRLPFGWALPWPLLIVSALLVAGVALLLPGRPDSRKA